RHTRCLSDWSSDVCSSDLQFLKHYTNQLALPLLILTNLTPPQIARFQEQSGCFPGLDLEVQPLRSYPYRTTAAHSIGYLIQDNRSEERRVGKECRAQGGRV